MSLGMDTTVVISVYTDGSPCVGVQFHPIPGENELGTTERINRAYDTPVPVRLQTTTPRRLQQTGNLLVARRTDAGV